MKERFIEPILSGKDAGARVSASPAQVPTWRASRPAPSATVTTTWSMARRFWTSGAHIADWMILLARTDPTAPQAPRTVLLLARHEDPGISLSPIINMAGNSGFNQVFFESVRVPAANMVGEEHRGWYVAATTLDFEAAW